MPLVLDASVVSAWLFPDEASSLASLAFGLLPSETAIVPALWWFEVRNAIMMAERRGRLIPEVSMTFGRYLDDLPLQIDRAPNSHRLLDIARRHRLTVYDASYVELAQRTGSRLASLDSAMVKAARAEGVGILSAH
jgi:predicted nucleic acid-binding protein